jgi:hypothetical protein
MQERNEYLSVFGFNFENNDNGFKWIEFDSFFLRHPLNLFIVQQIRYLFEIGSKNILPDLERFKIKIRHITYSLLTR